MSQIVISIPKRIENNIDGFCFFIELYNKFRNLNNAEIMLDFKKTWWLEANLTAILGAILYVALKNNNKIGIIRISKSVKGILIKNEFFKNFGLEESLEDSYKTTMKFAKFNEADRIEFQSYLKEEFIPKLKLSMTNEFSKELRLNLEEVFQNARIHGKCDDIYVCGQYYYEIGKVKFTVVDLGKTIIQNYIERFNKVIEDEMSIDWATKDGNSTKVGETGGIGLFQLREFLKENGGRIQIVSAKGYWEEVNDKIIQYRYNEAFEGTIVNIEVDVNNKIYFSKGEKENINEIYKEINNIF